MSGDGGAFIGNSTFSGNSAEYDGGLRFLGFVSASVTIENSTISGNSAAKTVGGVFSNFPTTVRNSTIAFNTAGSGSSNGKVQAPGMAMYSNFSNVSVVLESSILSNNTYPDASVTLDNDLSTTGVGSTVTVSGNHNLILATSASLAAGIVTVEGCPLLGPLRDNGGSTQTHALLSHSPAVDQGSDSQHYTYDQRGLPYKRADGLFANFTDIGAYEVQQEDVVFNTSFETCPTL